MSTIKLTEKQTRILEALGNETALDLIAFVLHNHGIKTILEYIEYSITSGDLEQSSILYDCTMHEITQAIKLNFNVKQDN